MIRPLRKVHSFYIFVDLVFITTGFYLSYLFRYNSPEDIFTGVYLPNFREYSFVFVLWAFFLLLALKMRNLYYTDRSLAIPKEIGRVCVCVLYTSVLIGAVVFFSQYKFFSRQIFLESVILFCVLLSAWRTVKRLILRKMMFRVVGFLDDNINGDVEGVRVLGAIRDFSTIIKKHFVDEVIITIPSETGTVNRLIKDAKDHRVGVRVVPQSFEEPLAISEMNYLGIVPLLTYKSRRQHPTEFFLKRLFDVAVSFILLAALFPVFMLIAVLIKLDSRGRVFYIQKRVGYKGNIFSLYKFRSMIMGADKLKEELMEENEVKDGIIFKIKKDPRITRVGAFLRKYSLDELPQLLNVLKGEMSLVGPRPPTADEVRQYDSSHMHRISIRPGMTGLSQVRGRSALSFRKWVKWDDWYINNWSFGLDLMILWWTVPAVLKGKGAY